MRKILFDICEADPRIQKGEGLQPSAPMTSMGACSIVLQLRAWTESANYWSVLGVTTEAIYNKLTEAGIEIPFQQIDVHMRQ